MKSIATDTTERNETPSIQERIKSGKVPLNTSVSGDIYARIRKFQNDQGLTYPQDVVRMAIASFLNNAGY